MQILIVLTVDTTIYYMKNIKIPFVNSQGQELKNKSNKDISNSYTICAYQGINQIKKKQRK
jgi:hypothetical protein